MEMKTNVAIDTKKCIGCGLCIADCQRRDLVIQNSKSVPLNKNCFLCGHCLAICPENAITIHGFDDEIEQLPKDRAFLDSKSILTHLKSHRSVRNYLDKPVEKEKLEKIIEAGRLTPTGSNSQNVRYIVIQNGIDKIVDAVLAQYKNPVGFTVPSTFSPERFKRGFLFFNAPAIVLVISSNDTNACLAGRSMELMAEALGLGTVYVGLFTRPANLNKELRASLGVAEGENIAICLALGYSAVKYLRSVPRKKANVVWR